MAEWTSDKILGNSFITHETPNGYEIHFSTPDREKYLAVQEECRRQIDHAKPQTNADKIRQMTDEELAEWYWWMLNYVRGATDSRTALLDWLKQEVEDDG